VVVGDERCGELGGVWLFSPAPSARLLYAPAAPVAAETAPGWAATRLADTPVCRRHGNLGSRAAAGGRPSSPGRIHPFSAQRSGGRAQRPLLTTTGGESRRGAERGSPPPVRTQLGPLRQRGAAGRLTRARGPFYAQAAPLWTTCDDEPADEEGRWRCCSRDRPMSRWRSPPGKRGVCTHGAPMVCRGAWAGRPAGSPPPDSLNVGGGATDGVVSHAPPGDEDGTAAPSPADASAQRCIHNACR